MRLLEVTLQAPTAQMAALAEFYGTLLGSPHAAEGMRSGESELRFEPATGDDEPFYHFALLVPGDRFSAALAWARERVELLGIGDGTEQVMRFENWQADSCYFHDPVGNIVELIAHERFGASGADGPFGPRELLGISEIGLVGESDRVALALADAGLAIFSGDVSALAFVGEPTAALILSVESRGWLPQGRPAEAWPVTVRVGVPGGRKLELVHRPVDAVEQHFEVREAGDLPVADDLHPESLGDSPRAPVLGSDD